MSCERSSINTFRGNNATLYTRKNLVAIITDTDSWKGLYRCKECQTLFEETFEEARFAGIPVLQKVNVEYVRTH